MVFAYLYLYWTMFLTRETLMKINKVSLTVVVLYYKERFEWKLSALNDELKELKTNFCKLETDLASSRNISEKLTHYFNLVERKCRENKQNSCWASLEISVIPKSVQDDDLKDCDLKIFNECDTPVDLENIEASDRLKSKARQKKVIIKLSKRKKRIHYFTM